MQEDRYDILSQQGWEAMEQMLDKEMPRKKRSVFGWFFLMMGLLGATYGLWYVMQHDETVPVAEQQEQVATLTEERTVRHSTETNTEHFKTSIKEENTVALDKEIKSTELKNQSPGNGITETSNPVESAHGNNDLIAASQSARLGITNKTSEIINEGITVEDQRSIKKAEFSTVHSLAEMNNMQTLVRSNETMDMISMKDYVLVTPSPKLQKSTIKNRDITPQQSYDKWIFNAGIVGAQSFSNGDRSVGVELGMNYLFSRNFGVLAHFGLEQAFYEESLSSKEEIGTTAEAPFPAPSIGVNFNGNYLNPTVGLGLIAYPDPTLGISVSISGHLLSNTSTISNLKSSGDIEDSEALLFLGRNDIQFNDESDSYKLRLADHLNLNASLRFNINPRFYVQSGIRHQLSKVSRGISGGRLQGQMSAGFQF